MPRISGTKHAAEFLDHKLIEKHQNPPHETVEKWREHLFRLTHRLEISGVEIVPDLRLRAHAYVALRLKWQTMVAALTESMAYALE